MVRVEQAEFREKESTRPLTGGPVGQPTKFTKETREKILAFVRIGNYVGTACQAAGITTSTLHNWRKLAEADELPEYILFFEQLAAAEAFAEAEHVANIALMSKESWTASAWYLERKHNDRWGKKDKTELTGANGGPILMAGLIGTLIDAAKADELEAGEDAN